MKKITVKNLYLTFMALAAVITAVFAFLPMRAYASMEDKATPYYFGETYKGSFGSGNCETEKTFYFDLKSKSLVTLKLLVSGPFMDEVSLYNSSGKELLNKKDFKIIFNETKQTKSFSTSIKLAPGRYYFVFDTTSGRKYDYTFFGSGEPVITLSTPKITNLTNPGSSKMVVSYSAVKRRLGYQVEYSTSPSFASSSKACTGATSRSIAKLSQGKTYYVRVRAYALYGDGKTRVYSKWSGTKQITIAR